MFETLQESKSTAVVEKGLESLAGEDKARIMKKQILSGGLADWAMQVRQLFPKEADKLLGDVRTFFSVEEQAAETPQFDSIESYLQYRIANSGGMYAFMLFRATTALTNFQFVYNNARMGIP
jgi:hypothetical protein